MYLSELGDYLSKTEEGKGKAGQHRRPRQIDLTRPTQQQPAYLDNTL